MPADPKLNELAILEQLRNVDHAFTPNGIRTLLSLTLLATFDRGVKRRFFAEMIDLTTEASIMVADIECACRTLHVLSTLEPDRPRGELTEQTKALAGALKNKRLAIADKFQLVTEMATTEDKVH